MPKMKNKKAVTARFKKTGTGKLKRNKQGRRHILTKKPSKRKRRLRKSGLVHKTQTKMFSKLMSA